MRQHLKRVVIMPVIAGVAVVIVFPHQSFGLISTAWAMLLGMSLLQAEKANTQDKKRLSLCCGMPGE